VNAVAAFLDDWLARGRASAPAIATPGGAITYGEMHALACRTASALRALGAQRGDRVAILAPDGLAWITAFFGALRIGAIAVPLNTRLRPGEWTAMLRDSAARVLLTDDATARVLAPLRAELPSLHTIVVTPAAGVSLADGSLASGSAAAVDGELGDGCVPLDDRLARADAGCRPEPVSPDDMAFWLYTSGTTGAPKAAVHCHRDLLACRHYGQDVLGVTADDRVFATSKLFFAYALGNALLIPLFAGASTYVLDAWPDAERVRRVLEEFAPTIFFSVPTFYARLLRSDLPDGAFASVRCAVSAGERLPEEVARAFRRRFGVEILDGIGATETIFMVLANRPGQSRPGSSGRPVPGTEVRLLDGDGREVPDGAEGVLHVRTPSGSRSYWNRPEDSRRAFDGEWFRTGDLYVRDPDGFFHHRGRQDDRFKVAGMWVAPGEVEAVLLSHAGVADAGVVGAEDGAGLVKALAFVVPAAGDHASLPAELDALCAAKLAPHQRPRRIAVVPELPRTATGKLQRFLLRDLGARDPAPRDLTGRG
jgi:benzoate-CoA ligase family protein